jgi:hypothetical protein
MIFALVFLVLLCIALMLCLVVFFKKLEEKSEIIENVETQITESLDILDKCYKDIGGILNIPLFYDDAVVKNALSIIKRSHHSVLLVANKISSIDIADDYEGNDEQENQSSEESTGRSTKGRRTEKDAQEARRG